MYRPNRIKPVSQKRPTVTSLMGKSGLNLSVLPELLNPAYALNNENYFVMNNRGLSKRKGIVELTTVAGNKAITMLEYWKGYYIFGYETTVAAYNPTTDTVTNIKTNWATNASFSGAPYGNFFFVGNTGNKIHYITEAGGVFTITEIAAAPQSGVIKAIDTRLFAGVGNAVYYSDVDDTSDPPFDAWTVAELATAGGIASFRNAGTVRSICSLGNIIVAFGTTGKYAFKLTQQTDGTGTTVKIEEPVIDRVDMGGASGAKTTPKGLFYVNKAGLWQLISLGQPNIPYSEQESLTSVLLGTDYFADVSLDSCDIVYYDRFNTVLVTCAKQSTQNNHVIAYNPDIKAFSTFRNWNINRWMSYASEIYGASSVKTTLYHCFTGNSDDGVNIGTDYLQELKCGDLMTRQDLVSEYIKGWLHPLSVVKVAYDVYNRRGELEQNKLEFLWTPQYSILVTDGWGIGEWGRSPWGGDVDLSGLLECFGGQHWPIKNFQRVRIRITESSQLPLQIDWCSIEVEPKGMIRRRDLDLISIPT
jgi:hypothetical protein